MKIDTIRKKDVKSLNLDLEAKQKELADTRFDHKTGKEKDPARIKVLKKNIARILTVINELNTMKIDAKSDKMNDDNKKVNKVIENEQ